MPMRDSPIPTSDRSGPPLPLRDGASAWAPYPGPAGALGLLLLYGMLQVVASLLIGLMLLGVGPLSAPRPDLDAYQAAAATVIAALLMLRIVRGQWPERWSPAHAAEGFGLTRPTTVRFYAIAVLVGLATAPLGDALTATLAHGHPVPQSVDQLGQHASMAARVVLVLPAITLVPLLEEVLFRGVLLCALLNWPPNGAARGRDAPSRQRMALAIATSATLFGLAHLPELSWQWYGLPTLALSGGMLAWLRIRSASLWPAVIAHSATNAVAALAVLGAVAPPH